MRVFKFGGASISSADKIKNVGEIIRQHPNDELFLVISAMGKTTNALEKVVEAFFTGTKEKALQLFSEIKIRHDTLVKELLDEPITKLPEFYTEVEWLLYDKPIRNYDYYYDQIVCIGELLATSIVSHYLNKIGINNKWVDVRDILRTDDNFRDARIDWKITIQNTENKIQPLRQQHRIILTQGFIGATDENESTTLGREGSDYSAAVFANILNVKSQTIWKDVPGVMNADPKRYAKAKLITELSYREVIEMAYYGAQVIHPKTIKPLRNKNITLYVKSFLQPDTDGTVIHNKNEAQLPPIIVYKENQTLLQFSSKDFSFVSEGLVAEVYRIFDNLKFKPNLTQNAAISLLCVVDEHAQKVEQLVHAATPFFDVQLRRNLRLLTIRHYDDAIIKELIADQKVILRQQTMETVQVLIEEKG
ncbi:MAG: aspartate kinase [Bacteroidota bacterium]|nr:aspartate kinase [Bacteroidota bacterium]